MPSSFPDPRPLFVWRVGFSSIAFSLVEILSFLLYSGSSSHGHSVVYTCTGCKTSRRIPAPPTAHTPSPPELQPQTQPQIPAVAPLLQEILTAHDPSQFKAELPATKETSVLHRKRDRKATLSCLPPLFARQDAGHVTFRGNERLLELDWEKGHGMFLVWHRWRGKRFKPIYIELKILSSPSLDTRDIHSPAEISLQASSQS